MEMLRTVTYRHNVRRLPSRAEERATGLPLAASWIAALGLSVALWGGFFAVLTPQAGGTDSEVGCIDDCLDLLDTDTTADAEPIRDDQEE